MKPDERRASAGVYGWVSLGVDGQLGARFHRERDWRLRRAMGVSLVCVGLLVGVALGAVGLRVHQVRLSYRLDALRTARTDLEEVNRRLRVELASLSSLARIEGKARAELGMVQPGRDQVQLAREFVTGGAGTRVHERRTAATSRLSPAPPNPR